MNVKVWLSYIMHDTLYFRGVKVMQKLCVFLEAKKTRVFLRIKSTEVHFACQDGQISR